MTSSIHSFNHSPVKQQFSTIAQCHTVSFCWRLIMRHPLIKQARVLVLSSVKLFLILRDLFLYICRLKYAYCSRCGTRRCHAQEYENCYFRATCGFVVTNNAKLIYSFNACWLSKQVNRKASISTTLPDVNRFMCSCLSHIIMTVKLNTGCKVFQGRFKVRPTSSSLNEFYIICKFIISNH